MHSSMKPVCIQSIVISTPQFQDFTDHFHETNICEISTTSEIYDVTRLYRFSLRNTF